MRRDIADRVAPPIYGLVDFAVIMAPSLALKYAAVRGGMSSSEGLDLLLGSLLVAVPHALIASARLRNEERVAVRRADMWIAALNALVVLAIGATVLLIVVLHGFTDEHSSMANQGYPVMVLWIGVQIIAVALAEVAGRVFFWWLEPHGALRRRHRRRHLARAFGRTLWPGRSRPAPAPQPQLE